ncbi:MAG TPA: hypothetical protein VGL23_08920, partial [Chloroflexota bacterium]
MPRKFRFIPRVAVALAVALAVFGRGVATEAAPPAPNPLSPANGASLVEPLTLTWSTVGDPTGLFGYRWEVSTTTTFATRVATGFNDARAASPSPTQATLSGLPNGTYFWRVQAQNKALVNGAFSAPVSFVVTGSAAGTPATPTVTGPAANARFHPYEDLTISWTSAAGAASYELEVFFASSFDPAQTSVDSIINVDLTNSNAAAISSMPFGIAVPAGATSADFTIWTSSTTAPTTVTITASDNGVTRSSVLNIGTTGSAAPTLTGITFNPGAVNGGQTSQGTVSLSAAAPAGGASVTLKSGSPSVATVPASATIPAGATSASFTVTTQAVAASTSAAISAAYGGASSTAILTVTPGGTTGTADTVKVSLAEYVTSDRVLNVAATSTSASATLTVSASASGAPIG